MTTTCPACSKSAARVNGNGIARCTCGTMFRHPFPTPDALKEAYQAYYGDGSAEATEASPANLADQLVHYLDRQKIHRRAVLDFGCGSGAIALRLSSLGSRVVGVEPGPRFASAAREAGLQVCSDLSELGSAEQFDVALLVEVIEHLADPLVQLRLLRERLRLGGVLVITTPHARGLNARLSGDRWRELQNPTHLTLFSRQGLRVLLSRAGFHAARGPRLRYAPERSAQGFVHSMLSLLGLQGGLVAIATKQSAPESSNTAVLR